MGPLEMVRMAANLTVPSGPCERLILDAETECGAFMSAANQLFGKALKFAHALGADVTLFTTSAGRADDARRLGANHVVISKNQDEMKTQANSFDFILDCVAADHSIDSYLARLKLDGTLVLVGVPEKSLALTAFNLILPRKQLAGSGIGSIAETR